MTDMTVRTCAMMSTQRFTQLSLLSVESPHQPSWSKGREVALTSCDYQYGRQLFVKHLQHITEFLSTPLQEMKDRVTKPCFFLECVCLCWPGLNFISLKKQRSCFFGCGCIFTLCLNKQISISVLEPKKVTDFSSTKSRERNGPKHFSLRFEILPCHNVTRRISLSAKILTTL